MLLVDDNGSVVADFDARNSAKQIGHRFLADGADDHVHIDLELTAKNRNYSPALASIALLKSGPYALDPCNFTLFAEYSNWLGVPVEKNAVEFRKIVFITERRHFLFA